jgi:hypothetical protein
MCSYIGDYLNCTKSPKSEIQEWYLNSRSLRFAHYPLKFDFLRFRGRLLAVHETYGTNVKKENTLPSGELSEG